MVRGELEPAGLGAAQAVEEGRGHREVDDQHRHRDLGGHAVAEPEHQQRRQREHRQRLADHQERHQPALGRCARPRATTARRGAEQAAQHDAEQDLAQRDRAAWCSSRPACATQRAATRPGPGRMKGGTPVAQTSACQASRRPSSGHQRAQQPHDASSSSAERVSSPSSSACSASRVGSRGVARRQAAREQRPARRGAGRPPST